MSQNNVLSRSQRTMLIRYLIEMADENNFIPFTAQVVSAKLSERLGRTISDMTTRAYLKDSGFTWQHRSPLALRKVTTRKADRICELARIVQVIWDAIGIEDEHGADILKRIIDKQSVSQDNGNGTQQKDLFHESGH